MIVVTNPNLPAVTDALKTCKIAEEAETHILGVLLNRVKGTDAELSNQEVEDMIGYPIVAEVPEHDMVDDAVSNKTPAVNHDPRHHVSERFRVLAAELAGIDYEPRRTRESFFDRVKNWFTQ